MIPLLDRLSSALASWLGPMFGQDLRLAHDLDEIPALAPRRRMKWQQIQAADFLTLNEKRQALGYEPIEAGDGDTEQKNSEDYERIHGRPQPRIPVGQSDAGRWTSGSSESVMPTLLANTDEEDALSRNPLPEDIDCVDEWMRTFKVCRKELAKRPLARSRGIYGAGFFKCLMGQVSERCGGNRVDRKRKSHFASCEHGCAGPSSSRTVADEMIDELAEINRLYNDRRNEEVVALTKERLGRVPNCRETRVLRATALEMLKRLDEAIDDWTVVALLDPDDAAPYYTRGTLHFRRRRYTQALADFNRAEQLDDGYFAEAIYMDRAWCYLRLDDLERAMTDIEAIPPDKDYDRFRHSLTEALEKARANRRQSG